MPEPLTPAGATPVRRRSEKLALLYAALVLLAGSALGAGGFLLEQATANWRPHTVRTQSGWRITEMRKLGFSGLALCDEHIAWQDGSSLLLLDLRSGEARLLGPGNTARATWQPAVSKRYVVWFEGSRAGASSAKAWTYDVATRRRRQIAVVDDVRSFPSVSVARTVWCTARGAAARIVGADLTDDQGFVVASEYGQPVIDGSLVAWVRSTAGGPGSFMLADVTQNRSWTVVRSGLGGVGDLTGFDLSGRTLVWGQQDAQTAVGRIVAQNVDTGTASIVAEDARMASAAGHPSRSFAWTARSRPPWSAAAPPRGWSTTATAAPPGSRPRRSPDERLE